MRASGDFPVRGLATGLALLTTLGAGPCSHGDNKQQDTQTAQQNDQQPSATDAGKALGGLVGGIMKMAARQDSMDKLNPYASMHDPCVLVSRAEMEKYLGPLRADPYRNNTSCVYPAADGQSIGIDVSFTGGQMAMKMMNAVGGLTSKVFVDDAGKADTLEGPWDDARWMTRVLHTVKGDVGIDVDVSSSKANPVQAAEIATIAYKRLPSPLNYDGDAAHAPGPLVAQRDPCSLVTKAEATAILGPLTGDPQSDKSGCTFTIPSPMGQGQTMPVLLRVSWTGGFNEFGSQKDVANSFTKSFIKPVMGQANADQVDQKAKTDSATRRSLEQGRAMLNAMGGPAMKDGSLQPKTDTLVTGGPWADAAVLNGMSFSAVKKDVYIEAPIQFLGEKKARALVATAMGRI